MKRINSILVLAILVALLASCAASPAEQCEPKVFEKVATHAINRATAMYVGHSLGQHTYEEANRKAWQQWQLIKKLDCQTEESELVLIILKSTLWAIQAEHFSSDARIVNTYVDRAFNAMNELKVKYGWEAM